MFRHRLPPTRFIPPAALKVSDKRSDAIAYLYDDAKGRPCLKVFYGKQSKPVAWYRCRSTAERDKKVRELFESRQASDTRKAEYRDQRKATPNPFEVGDVLNTCWGYDQTNREFFEVIEVRGKFVIVREIAQVSEETGFMSGKCVPQSGHYIGEPLRRLACGSSIRIDDVRSAHKWNTGKVAGIAIGPTLGWTDGH